MDGRNRFWTYFIRETLEIRRKNKEQIVGSVRSYISKTVLFAGFPLHSTLGCARWPYEAAMEIVAELDQKERHLVH